MKPKILIVDDEQLVLNAIKRSLNQDFDVLLSLSGPAALTILKETPVSVLIADQRMPEMTGVELFLKARDIQPGAVRILLTGYSDRNVLIQAINDGAIYHYLAKPWEPDELKHIVRQAAERNRLETENARLIDDLEIANRRLAGENLILKQEVKRHYQFDQIVGESPAIKAVFALMEKVIPTDVTVFIQGETGTGKELVARAIHYNGPRQKKLFVAQNCGAIPDTLLESTLFGHRKGAFTDAMSDRPGLFEVADGGTIFLDEIGEMSPAMQQRLLRVLENGEIQPVGSSTTRTVNVRVISATHRDLRQAVKDGTFREDLFFRLNVLPIQVPPLRERKEDIPLLAEHFLNKIGPAYGKTGLSLSKSRLDVLMNYRYPGNVRELENIISRAVILAEDNQPIDRLELPGRRDENPLHDESIGKTLKDTVTAMETRMIRRALAQNNGNISQTARQLGLSRVGLYKKMSRLSLD